MTRLEQLLLQPFDCTDCSVANRKSNCSTAPKVCVRGVFNCLRHLGLLADKPPDTRASLGLPPAVAVAAADRQDYCEQTPF